MSDPHPHVEDPEELIGEPVPDPWDIPPPEETEEFEWLGT